MINYSFDFMNETEVLTTAQKKATPTAPKVSKVSAGQIKFYSDLCKQKSEMPQPIDNFTFETMSAEIDRLIKIFKPSPSQIELIREKVRALNAINSTLELDRAGYSKIIGDCPEELRNQFNTYIYNNAMNTDIIMTMKDVKELTGGKDGTASKLISVLINLEKAHADNMPPEESQIKALLSMFMYPDANFEDYNIPRRVELEDGLWRKPTPVEFVTHIQSNMNKRDALTFLDMHRGGFYEWKQTRIRPEQLRYIMQLEKQMGDDSKLSKVETAVLIDGTTTIVPAETRENIKGTAYVAHTEEQLIQFSIEQASAFIDQLKAEINRKNDFSITNEYQDYDIFRKAKNSVEAINIEYKAFQDIMYSLEAIAGYEDDELHQSANYNLVADDSRESQLQNRLKIRAFMMDMVEQGAITYSGLLELGKDSVTLQRILLDM